MLITKELVTSICNEIRESKKIVFTNGCFDIIHCGHTDYLTKSKRLGDILIVGLNSDYSIKRLKGDNRPINNQSDRATVLSALKSVDYVVIFDEDTPYELIKNIQPSILTKGGDYKAEDIVGYEIANETIVIPFVDGKSTTSIINKSKL